MGVYTASPFLVSVEDSECPEHREEGNTYKHITYLQGPIFVRLSPSLSETLMFGTQTV